MHAHNWSARHPPCMTIRCCDGGRLGSPDLHKRFSGVTEVLKDLSARKVRETAPAGGQTFALLVSNIVGRDQPAGCRSADVTAPT